MRHENLAIPSLLTWCTFARYLETFWNLRLKSNSHAYLCSPCGTNWWHSPKDYESKGPLFGKGKRIHHIFLANVSWPSEHACHKHLLLLNRCLSKLDGARPSCFRHCQNIFPWHAQPKFSRVYYQSVGKTPSQQFRVPFWYFFCQKFSALEAMSLSLFQACDFWIRRSRSAGVNQKLPSTLLSFVNPYRR